MADFSFLPEIDDSGAESQDETPGPQVPEGHPPMGSGGGTCPFAAIQAVLDSRAGSGAPSPKSANVPTHHIEMSSRKALQQFQPTDLGDAIPEGLPGRNLAEVKHQPITCPMTGGTMQQRQSSMASLKDDDAKSSRSRGMSLGASSRNKSRKSKQSRNSKKGPRQNVRRTKKAPTFSQWEAQTYIPSIKKAWADILSVTSLDDVGVIFYDELFKQGGHEIEHMFTTEKSIMSMKFAEMLSSIVASVDAPYSMYEKLKGLAPMHLTKGVSKDHLPIMGRTLFAVLEGALQDKFDTKARTAWEWLWTWLGATFTQSLEEAGNNSTLISQSWDMAMDNCPDETLGALLYDTLFELAPNLKAVFAKPRQILSVKFVEMLSTLVSFHQKLDGGYNEQLVWLGLRHKAYGAKFSHVEVLQQVLCATMERAIGEEWTEEMNQSWAELWLDTCNKLLAITQDAEKHGEVVREMWKIVQQRTDRQKFGSALRKMLLSGTEWVQSLSVSSATPLPDKPGDTPGKAGPPAASAGSARPGPSLEKGAAAAAESGDRKRAQPQGTYADKSTDAEAIGNQFWEMLTVILDLLWEPEQQNEKLILMTTRFFHCGIRVDHLDTIGTAIQTSSQRVMGDLWNQSYKEAWDWFWNLVSHSMARTLKVCQENHADVINRSWALCKETMPKEDLGESFFQELALLAPHVIHLFKRPKRIQAFQFVAAVELLVSFADDPEHFFQELKPLTIRHIKYGVKADYAKAFGTAILRGVAKCLGPKWDAETQMAWEMLWDRCSSCVTRSLNAGTNLVIVSLVNGDLEKVKEAMDCAPRGERFDTLTRVDVNGEVLSPLYWSIRDGLRDIAVYLLQDLLSIRADRHSYYFGREKLFETHPDIVEVLCQDPGAEELLDTMFDGLMWHGNTVTNGRLKVNYYIKELYGDPAEVGVWQTGLATLATLGPPAIFLHPVTEKLLESKWKKFGNAMFVMMQATYITIAILYFLGFVLHGSECGPWGWIRIVTGALSILVLLLQLALVVRQIRSGQAHYITLDYPSWMGSVQGRLPAKVAVPRTLMNVWNVSRIPAYTVVAVVVFSKICVEDGGHVYPVGMQGPYSDSHHIATSIGTLILGLQLFEVLQLIPSVAALMLLVRQLAGDVVRTCMVVVIMLVSFAGALSVTRETHFDSFGTSLVTILELLLGTKAVHLDDMPPYGLTLISILVVCVNIAVFNMLIAQLVNRSRGLHTNAECIVMKRLAYLCVEMESLLPSATRARFHEQMRFDQPLDFDAGDDGPSGGFQAIEPASVRSHPKYVPDRIQRFTGESTASDPWPSFRNQEDDREEVADYD